MAGFGHALAVEIDPDACETLRLDRPDWDAHEGDACEVDRTAYEGVDFIAGGVPCPPFSIAGKQLGANTSPTIFSRPFAWCETRSPAP